MLVSEFTALYPEFYSYSESIISNALALAENMNEVTNETVSESAVGLIAAHHLALKTNYELGVSNKLATIDKVNTAAEEKFSRQADEKDDYYTSTAYGLQYLALRGKYYRQITFRVI